jgi:hypothetical protein
VGRRQCGAWGAAHTSDVAATAAWPATAAAAARLATATAATAINAAKAAGRTAASSGARALLERLGLLTQHRVRVRVRVRVRPCEGAGMVVARAG